MLFLYDACCGDAVGCCHSHYVYARGEAVDVGLLSDGCCHEASGSVVDADLRVGVSTVDKESRGYRVRVDVDVAVGIAVWVDVGVFVAVGVTVGVRVGLGVEVMVGVGVGVSCGRELSSQFSTRPITVARWLALLMASKPKEKNTTL